MVDRHHPPGVVLQLNRSGSYERLPTMTPLNGCRQCIVAVAKPCGFFETLLEGKLAHAILQWSEKELRVPRYARYQFVDDSLIPSPAQSPITWAHGSTHLCLGTFAASARRSRTAAADP